MKMLSKIWSKRSFRFVLSVYSIMLLLPAYLVFFLSPPFFFLLSFVSACKLSCPCFLVFSPWWYDFSCTTLITFNEWITPKHPTQLSCLIWERRTKTRNKIVVVVVILSLCLISFVMDIVILVCCCCCCCCCVLVVVVVVVLLLFCRCRFLVRFGWISAMQLCHHHWSALLLPWHVRLSLASTIRTPEVCICIFLNAVSLPPFAVPFTWCSYAGEAAAAKAEEDNSEEKENRGFFTCVRTQHKI